MRITSLPEPETSLERQAVIVWYLAHGMALSTREAAILMGVSDQRARKLLCDLARVLPLYRDDDWVWRRMQVEPLRQL